MEWSEFSFVLRPSQLGGIGVFAAHDLEADTLIFRRFHELRILKIKDIPRDFLKYCIYISDEEVVAPERFDRMEIGWFINHADDPNIENRHFIRNTKRSSIAEMLSDMKIRSIFTKKPIKAGEEILINYNNLNEPSHLKEAYYRPYSSVIANSP